MMRTNFLWVLIGVLLLGISLTLSHRFPHWLQASSDIRLSSDPACALQSAPCATVLPGGGRIELDITPRPLLPASPLRVEVRVEGFQPAAMAIEFTGVEMNMGLNRAELERHPAGRFHAMVSLPVCTAGRMLWQATLIFDGPAGRLAVPFRFHAPP